MTDKKENILNTALTLFANEGFSATSTNKIAKAAGVSEGLIFRHFKNKEGLLEAILQSGEERLKTLFSTIIFESKPQKVLENTFNLYLQLAENKEEADFWKLQYKIKWEIELYSEHKMEALQFALSNAFKKQGYKTPEQEAEFLLIHMDGLATRFFLQKNFDLPTHIEYLKEKYKQ